MRSKPTLGYELFPRPFLAAKGLSSLAVQSDLPFAWQKSAARDYSLFKLKMKGKLELNPLMGQRLALTLARLSRID